MARRRNRGGRGRGGSDPTPKRWSRFWKQIRVRYKLLKRAVVKALKKHDPRLWKQTRIRFKLLKRVALKSWKQWKEKRMARKDSSTRRWIGENQKEFSGYSSFLLLLALEAALLYFVYWLIGDQFVAIDPDISWYQKANLIAFQALIGFLVAVFSIFLLFIMTAPAIPSVRDRLLYDVEKMQNREKQYALYVSIEPWQTMVRVRNGKFVSFIRGWENPGFQLWSPWSWYKCYCWLFGLRVIGIPGLQGLLDYGIKRFRIHHKVADKKNKSSGNVQTHEISYESVEDRSNHVRTRPFTFPVIVSGAEIEKVPTSILGSIQARVIPYKEYNTFFNSDSWDTLLFEAVGSVIPGVVRSQLVLADVIGDVAKDLWGEESSPGKDINDEVGKLILKALKSYKFKIDGVDAEGKKYRTRTLAQLISIEIISVNITNFVLEVTEEEERQIRADILGRQEGRGRDLQGQGEGAAQKSIVDATKGAENGETVIAAQAFENAATKGGKIDTLLLAGAKKLLENS